MSNVTPPDLRQTWDEVWNLLQSHFERGATRQYVTLATCDAHGAPQMRTVALREADRDTARLVVFTDIASHKVGEIRSNPQVSILSWHPAPMVQLRLNGRALIESGPALRPLWEALPDQSLLSYSHQPPPGERISASDDYVQIPDFTRFAKVTISLDRVDHVILAETGHRRALFERSTDWTGCWRSP